MKKNDVAPPPSVKKLPTPVKKSPANASKFAQTGNVSTNTVTTTTSTVPYVPVKTKLLATSISTSSNGSPKKWPDPILATIQPKLAEPVNKMPPTFDKFGISKPNSPPQSITSSKPNTVAKFKISSVSKQNEDEDEEPRRPIKTKKNVNLVQAKYNYRATREDELDIIQGDIITIVQEEDEDGWAYGEIEGKTGYFPYSFVKKYDPRTTIFFGNDQNDNNNEVQFIMLNCHLDNEQITNIRVKRNIKFNNLEAQLAKNAKN